MAEDTGPLASLSLTHVYYDPTDPVSHLCAYLALIPQALVIAYATLLLSTREAEVLLLFAGQLACEAANFLLKRLIKEARPARIPGKGYGMPSSHAQFVAFWCVSVALFLLVRHGGGTRAGRSWPLPARLVVSALAFGVAGAVAASRVYLSYHTPRQVFAGLSAGTVCALAWFGVTYAVRSSGLLGQLLDSHPARLLLLRDLVVEEDPTIAGWERWDALRRAGTVPASGGGEARHWGKTIERQTTELERRLVVLEEQMDITGEEREDITRGTEAIRSQARTLEEQVEELERFAETLTSRCEASELDGALNSKTQATGSAREELRHLRERAGRGKHK